jgi:hypothetical protein
MTLLSDCSDSVTVGTDQFALGDFCLNESKLSARHHGLGDVEQLAAGVDVVKIHALWWEGSTTVHAWARLTSRQPGESFGVFDWLVLGLVGFLVGQVRVAAPKDSSTIGCDITLLTIPPTTVEVGLGFIHVTLVTSFHLRID